MNIYKSFELFWSKYHELNPQKKIDKDRCKELWKACNFVIMKKDAIQNIPKKSSITALEYLKIKLNITACCMVSKATHTAIYEIQNLIGFINYDRLLALVFAGGINTEKNE